MPVTLKRMLKWSVAISTVAIILLLRWLLNGQHRLSQSKPYDLTTIEPSTQRGLRPLDPSDFCNQSDYKCVNVAIAMANLNFPICVYEMKDDVYISKTFLTGGYYDSDLVLRYLDFMRRHPNMTFVDLGANLGTYSLPLAHAGIHTVAVEPYRDTYRRLAKSICMGKIEHTIDLFDCALSNETTTMFLKIFPDNRGGTFLFGNESCELCLSTKVTVLNNLVPFIRNKKAIFKVDTEVSEIKIFQQHSAGMFFDQIDVLMIQMEWMGYIKRYADSENGRRQVDQFLEFFYQRGYDVYHPRTENKLNSKWEHWPADIIFKKKNLPTDKIFYA